MPEDNEQEQLAKLIAIIQDALHKDEQLRQTYQVGEKFRFIRERLTALLETVQSQTYVRDATAKPVQEVTVEEDELLVYVHLYNAQGALVRTWQSVISPKAFFDFSVNRPIYQDKKHIEEFIRSKSNKAQHAFLTIAMKKERVLPSHDEGVKDAMGNPLIRIKEGSLRFERLVCFTHNEMIYTINEEGTLIVKKQEG